MHDMSSKMDGFSLTFCRLKDSECKLATAEDKSPPKVLLSGKRGHKFLPLLQFVAKM